MTDGHRCYACADSNPARLSFDGGLRLRVSERFPGPPGNVNGGLAVGMLACPVLQAAERDGFAHATVSRIATRLRAGVPLDRDLAVEVSASDDGGYAISVHDGDTEVMTATADVRTFDSAARPGSALAAIPEDRAADVAELAALAVPDTAPWYEETGDHPIPGCFSCGPKNAAGLHIYPRVVEDGVTCAPWTSAAEFNNGDDTLPLAVLTSAIDCSSGICMPVQMQRDLLEQDQFFLLGSMDVHYLRVPPAGGMYRVAAKALRRDGRKFYGLSVLADDTGTVYAMAESTWIIASTSRTAAFGTSGLRG
jgi:hypothetical protein